MHFCSIFPLCSSHVPHFATVFHHFFFTSSHYYTILLAFSIIFHHFPTFVPFVPHVYHIFPTFSHVSPTFSSAFRGPRGRTLRRPRRSARIAWGRSESRAGRQLGCEYMYIYIYDTTTISIYHDLSIFIYIYLCVCEFASSHASLLWSNQHCVMCRDLFRLERKIKCPSCTPGKAWCF